MVVAASPTLSRRFCWRRRNLLSGQSFGDAQRHDWASFAFQGSRRLAEEHTFGLPLLLASAFLLLSPTGAIATIILLRRRVPSHLVTESTDRQRAWHFQQISLGAPLAVFTVFSLFHEIVVDWLGPVWIAALPCMAYCIVHARDIWARGLFARLPGVWLPTLLALLLFDGLRFEYFAVGIPGFGEVMATDPGNPFPVGWRELGRQESMPSRSMPPATH